VKVGAAVEAAARGELAESGEGLSGRHELRGGSRVLA
jgi:hypothetical protein